MAAPRREGAHAQVEKLTGVKPEELFVDKGYRGTQHHPENVAVYISGRKLSGTLKRLLRRRSAIEPLERDIGRRDGEARDLGSRRQGDLIGFLRIPARDD